MKQKLTDTNLNVSQGGRVENYWLTRVLHPNYANEEAKSQEIDMVAILKEYHMKGFEFGNWVNQNDRHDFVHAFTRSAQIMSEIIGSKNIGLDLLLGVAFGARGRGGAAVAHYEPGHNMINLTKEKSYGSLAHEWGHAIDYNLGRHVDQNKNFAYLTGGHSVAAILPSNTGAQLRMWANAVVDEAKATPSYKRIEEADEYWHRRTEVWARFFEQYIAYQCKLKNKSPRFLSLTFESYAKNVAYWTEADFVKIARGSMFSFIAVLKGVLNNRYTLTACPYKYKTRDMLYQKPGKATKPKYTLPLYVVLKGRKPTDGNILKFDKTEIENGVVYYIGRDINATPKQAYRRISEDKLIQDYDHVQRATAERIIRAKDKPKAAAKPKTKAEVRKPIVKIKPLENFVLTKTGKLCTDQKAVSEWASTSIATWKRVYVVYHYTSDKQTRLGTHFVVKMKNGQYYVSDLFGYEKELNRKNPRWNLFIHPTGEKSKTEGKSNGSHVVFYAFRNPNEAVYFAKKIGKYQETKEDTTRIWNIMLKGIYETEYHYALYPNRRGSAVAMYSSTDKPQPVKTITRK